jgi:hypothetical protein
MICNTSAIGNLMNQLDRSAEGGMRVGTLLTFRREVSVFGQGLWPGYRGNCPVTR